MNALTAFFIIAKKLEIIQMPISGRIKHLTYTCKHGLQLKKENGLLTGTENNLGDS